MAKQIGFIRWHIISDTKFGPTPAVASRKIQYMDIALGDKTICVKNDNDSKLGNIYAESIIYHKQTVLVNDVPGY